MSEHLGEARAFADSVQGVLGRHPPGGPAWAPGATASDPGPELSDALAAVGWETLADDASLVACAGLGAVALGRGQAPLRHIDRLLGGSPLAGDLVRYAGPGTRVVTTAGDTLVGRPLRRSEACPSAEGLDVHRVFELGDAIAIGDEAARAAVGAWRAATVGYLAGLGQGALELTVGYARRRHAFGSTLAGLAPVQQLLAGAATAVGGVRLLAGEGPDGDALAHAGPVIAQACGACQQVSGAIGFTLEYPLHGFTQRARSLAVWNDAVLLDGGLGRF